MKTRAPFGGPDPGAKPGLHELDTGVWLTSGRAVVLEGCDDLIMVDPGDESREQLEADLSVVEAASKKRLGWVVVTHAHPDHVSNVGSILARGSGIRLVAHADSPLTPDLAVGRRGPFPWGGDGEIIPTPGHSSWGDDISLWLPSVGLLLSGDVVQPKGDTWDHLFYPSPFPYFTDGAIYAASLEALLALPLTLLVTGHREVRRGGAAKEWVRLTHRSITDVKLEVDRWTGVQSLEVAAPEIFRRLCDSRGLPDSIVQKRLAGNPSAFEQFDLPGIRYYWRSLRT